MTRFTRYILAELLKSFTLALVGLTLLLLVLGVVREAHSQGLGPAETARLLPYLLPDMLRYTLPATMLFAVSSVYGRMSNANEVVAIKALGIHPFVLLWPALVLAFMLSLATVWLNDVAVTWGQSGVQRVVVEAVEEVAYGMLRTQRSFISRTFTVNVKDVEGRRLILPTFTFQARGNAPAMTVMAAEAELRSVPGGKLLIACRDVTIEAEGRLEARLDAFEQELPLAEVSTRGDNSYLPARMAMRELPERIREAAQSLAGIEARYAALAACQAASGDIASLADAEWERRAATRRDLANHLHRLRTEAPRRWAGGFSCLCFALVGAPMAIRRRNADFLTSFFLCFLPILMVYYPLLAFGLDRAKNGVLHPWSVWGGNLLLLLWAVWLLRRVVRY
jgi:lipopolysaccharide export system permease protein